MALPSQSARTTSTGRTTMSRKGKPSGKAIAAGGALVLVLAVAGWALTRNGDGHDDVSPPPLAGASGGESGPKPAPSVPEAPARVMAVDTPKPEPTPPPVFELRQGAGEPGIPAKSAEPTPTTTPVSPVLGSATPPPAPAVSPPAAAQLSVNTTGLPTDLAAKLSAARSKDGEGDWVAARYLYSQALADARLSEAEKAGVRDRLSAINAELVFSPKVVKDDPFTQLYEVQPGDMLIKIAQRVGTSADWRLLQRINRMSNPGALRVGQKLKVIRDPFHFVINKSAFRMDIYLGPAASPERWVYIRSARVGLGDPEKFQTTPVGDFIVKKNSKMVNPQWTNPHTGEKFAGGDPKNPIGKHWIGLEGQGEAAAYSGYGIHGTVDPDSIGQQKSMGCIRLLADDIALVYELLTESGSTVQIRP